MVVGKFVPAAAAVPTNCARSAGALEVQPDSKVCDRHPVRMMSKSPDASMSAMTGIEIPLCSSVPVHTPTSGDTDELLEEEEEELLDDDELLDDELLEDELLEEDPTEPPPHAASATESTAGNVHRAHALTRFVSSIASPGRGLDKDYVECALAAKQF